MTNCRCTCRKNLRGKIKSRKQTRRQKRRLYGRRRAAGVGVRPQEGESVV
jgi:hypothetical protein